VPAPKLCGVPLNNVEDAKLCVAGRLGQKHRRQQPDRAALVQAAGG
jgi:hypothetical protein